MAERADRGGPRVPGGAGGTGAAGTAAGEPVVDPTIATLSFDEALAELQRTVAALEQGGQPLEESIALYERGVALHERCARLLGEAEVRVQKLVARAGGAIRAVDAREEGDEADEAPPF